jgi:hypothetical protein
MFRFIQILAVAFIMSACSTTSTLYQVFHTESKDASFESKSGAYAYDDANVHIDYNFWGKDGEMYFDLFNKSDKPIYVDLNKSHLIYNGEALNYFADKKIGLIRSTIQIPPKSFSSFKYEKPLTTGYPVCGISYQKKGDPDVRTFDEKTSPLKFRNYVTYDYSEAFSSPLIIDSKFWVEKIYYMQEALYKGKGEYLKDCKGNRGSYAYSYPYIQDNNFYYKFVVLN